MTDGLNDASDKPDPSQRGDVTAYVREHDNRLPPVKWQIVKAPEAGRPIADHRVWPGDVLASECRILLVVDVTNDEAVCYDIEDDRYTVYSESHINEDLGDDVYRHAEVIEPPQTPVR